MPHHHCSRRQWLKLTAMGILSGSVLNSRSICSAAVSYDGLNTADYLGEVQIVGTVTTEKFFTEGPAYDGKQYLYFSNVAANQIYRFDTHKGILGELTLFRENTNAANGLDFDPEGNLVACEGGANDQGRVVRINVATGTLGVVMDRYEGMKLGAPNDLVINKRGEIFFTSRLANTDPKAGNVNAVYHVMDKGYSRVLHWPNIDMPNGIELSPDGKTLYLVESDGRENKSRCIRAYSGENRWENPRVLIDFYPGRSGDGMCVDAEGNLYIAAGLHATRKTSETLDTKPGIHVVTPAGKLVAFVQTPEDTITNCCFGGKDGKTLYVTCARHLIAIPSKRPGSRFG